MCFFLFVFFGGVCGFLFFCCLFICLFVCLFVFVAWFLLLLFFLGLQNYTVNA